MMTDYQWLACGFYALLGVGGLLVGSLTTALVPRMMHDTVGTMLTGRSRCEACGVTLRWWQLVPVLSWVLQRGKCNHCGAVVSAWYPLTELLMMGSWVLVGKRWSNWGVEMDDVLVGDVYVEMVSWGPLVLALLGVTLAVMCCVYDGRYQTVDRRLTLPFLLVAGLWAGAYSPLGWGQHALGVLVGGGFFAVQYLASRGRWLGQGDIDLGLVMGLWVGWPAVLGAVWGGYLLGMLWVLPLWAMGRLQGGAKIALGSFLMLSLVGHMGAKMGLWGWYLSTVGL